MPRGTGRRCGVLPFVRTLSAGGLPGLEGSRYLPSEGPFSKGHADVESEDVIIFGDTLKPIPHTTARPHSPAFSPRKSWALRKPRSLLGTPWAQLSLNQMQNPAAGRHPLCPRPLRRVRIRRSQPHPGKAPLCRLYGRERPRLREGWSRLSEAMWQVQGGAGLKPRPVCAWSPAMCVEATMTQRRMCPYW